VIALIVVIVIIVVIALGVVASYNRFVSQRNAVQNAWSDIDTELKRRYDHYNRYNRNHNPYDHYNRYDRNHKHWDRQYGQFHRHCGGKPRSTRERELDGSRERQCDGA